MERFLPFFTIFAGLMLVVAGAIFSERLSIITPLSTVSSTSVSIAPPIPEPTIPTPSLPPISGTTTPSHTATAPSPKKKVSVAIPTPLFPAAPIDRVAELALSASALRAALVNIICYSPIGSGLASISGSGVVIDPKGIVLTNAHIAQYLLLADRGVSCTIRSGSPAADRYKGALIFISPAWLYANANVLTQMNPIGTGERDFALVAVTRSVSRDPLPAFFSYVPLGLVPPQPGTPIAIGSYGAQFLQANQILSFLNPTLVYGTVRNVYTFATTTIDVLDLGGSAAAQEGSSGGGLITADGKLAGTIVTSTVEGDTSSRQLNAITASYIRADYATETGSPIDILLATPLAISVADFAAAAPAYESLLTANLH